MGEGPLDDPALAAEAGAGGDAPAGDDRRDAALAHQAAVLVMGHSRGRRGRPQGVFADRPIRPPIGRTASISGISGVTSLRWPPVSVTASGMPEASTSRWCFELKAGAIDRTRAAQEPPKTARTWLESAAAHDQSICPAAFRRTRRRWCNSSQTPAACQSRRRRQQVTPEP